MYSPMMPMPMRMVPPTNQMERMMDDQPGTTWLPKYLTMTQIKMAMEMRMNNKPTCISSRSGWILKDVTPSTAKFSIFLKGYLLSPAKRFSRLK